MQSPLDFVTRLSLTFEQANLDYSLHYANLFRQIGDKTTSDILQQIYEDEIGHVRHGLQWFRKWKAPSSSDWEAYSASFEFPMSPQRARGPLQSFNRAGRIAAGLSDDFIDSVELYRQSKGRTPSVYWFDSAAEARLRRASDGSPMPREDNLLDQLTADLELVMIALAKQDDILLTRRLPSQDLRRKILDAGLELPELVPWPQRTALAKRKLRQLLPWAWTPYTHETAEKIQPAAREQQRPWRTSEGGRGCP